MPMRHLMMLPIAAALAACQAGDAGNGTAGNGQDAGQRQAARTIGETAGQTADLAQFNRAVEAAGLTETLRGAGPYTVFAPVNAGFDRVPQDTRTLLMGPEGREQLTELLTYHIVPGVVTAQDLTRAMERGQGRTTLSTVSGGNLTVSREGDVLVISDAAGGRARVSMTDQIQSNGVIHHIDAVLMPTAP